MVTRRVRICFPSSSQLCDLCVLCGSATAVSVFIVEEVLEDRLGFQPACGHTLTGLAAGVPLRPEARFSSTSSPPQPRVLLRVVNPKQTAPLVGHRDWCAWNPRR